MMNIDTLSCSFLNEVALKLSRGREGVRGGWSVAKLFISYTSENSDLTPVIWGSNLSYVNIRLILMVYPF